MPQAKKIELDKDKILKQLVDLSNVVVKDKWVLDYDDELDELFFGKAFMPKGSFLMSINDELNLFVTPKSKVNGIFVEYFARNYIAHNKKMKPVMQVFEKGRKQDKKTVDFAKEALEEKLQNQAVSSVFKKKKLVAAVL